MKAVKYVMYGVRYASTLLFWLHEFSKKDAMSKWRGGSNDTNEEGMTWSQCLRPMKTDFKSGRPVKQLDQGFRGTRQPGGPESLRHQLKRSTREFAGPVEAVDRGGRANAKPFLKPR